MRIRKQNSLSTILNSTLSLLLLISGVCFPRAGDLKGKVNIKADAIAVAVQDVKGAFTSPDSHAVIDQKNMRFDPILLPVVVGTTVDFPNSETVIYHNVFSVSPSKIFSLGTYRKGKTRSITFDKTGVVEIFCSIHVRMYAVVSVMDNPYFSLCDDVGRFEIYSIPSGNYTVKAILIYSKNQEYVEIQRKVFIPQEGVATLIFHKEKP